MIQLKVVVLFLFVLILLSIMCHFLVNVLGQIQGVCRINENVLCLVIGTREYLVYWGNLVYKWILWCHSNSLNKALRCKKNSFSEANTNHILFETGNLKKQDFLQCFSTFLEIFRKGALPWHLILGKKCSWETELALKVERLTLQGFVQGWAEVNPKYAHDLLKNVPPRSGH